MVPQQRGREGERVLLPQPQEREGAQVLGVRELGLAGVRVRTLAGVPGQVLLVVRVWV